MPNDTASPTVPVKTLANLFNLTEIRVQQLAKMGVVVKAARGTYELWPSIKGYIKYLQERAVGKGVEDGDGSEYQKHRSRLYRARADKEEVEALLMKGKAYDGDIIDRVVGDLIMKARARLLTLPTKAAGKVQSILPPAEVEDILMTHVRETLTELASYDPRDLVDEFVEKKRESFDDLDGAAKEEDADAEA